MRVKETREKMKKKLLFIINQMYRGGAETSLVNLLNQLDPLKVEVDLLIFNQCPVKNAESIIEEIKSWINVYDAYKEYKKKPYISSKLNNIMYSYNDRSHYYFEALNFVHNKKYDWAFHVGEWHEPYLIAKHVKAKNKCLWIHNDLSKAEYFNADAYFAFDEQIDYYIFVSNNSLKESCQAYPFIKSKSYVIYNINNVDRIKKKAKEIVTEYKNKNDLPIILTVGNFRLQKNHIRQVKVMKLLWDQGIRFRWFNIGALTDKTIVKEVKELVKRYNLEDHFYILGPQQNPYKFMQNCDVVTVLSNYESWSMVITEAKILGKPVIATKTSGALEQIEDKTTGILTEFDEDDIATQMEEYLTNKQLQNTIKANVNNFDNTNEILESFYKLIYTPKKLKKEFNNKILYIIDDINYLGGAHIATHLQIKELIKKGQDVTIFSNNIPTAEVRNNLLGVKFKNWQDIKLDILYNKRIAECLLDKNLSKEMKNKKIKLTYESKIKHIDVFNKYVKKECIKLFSEYNTVCVMSEGSYFKKEVAKANCKHKIQWIHIDYCDWIYKDEFSRYISKDDSKVWRYYDDIVVLTENIKEKFCKLYPHLASKVTVLKNLMPVEEIKNQVGNSVKDKPLEFITVGRIDIQKDYPRLIEIIQRLNEEGEKFNWTIVGDGGQYHEVKKMIDNSTLSNNVFLVGAQFNPFKFIEKADIFALLSDYEGLPNTIYEALILGKPVVATNVGGVKTQVIPGETGWLAENNKKSIYETLKYILNHRDEVQLIQKKVNHYDYDNKSIIKNIERLFIK